MITPTCCHHSAPLIEGAAVGNRSPEPISQLKEVTMARPYLPSFFGRGDDPFGSLFREVQKTFEDFYRRTERDAEPIPSARQPRPKRVSRPTGFHHRPLAEPSVRLSPHSALIRQTCRSCRAASVRRGPRFHGQGFRESDPHGSCELQSA